MNRRSFLGQSSSLALGAAALTMLTGRKAFSQEAEVPACPPPLEPPKIMSTISRNHGHELVLSYEEVIKGEPKVYQIQGRSGHPHTIELTPEIFEVLRKQSVVQVESTLDAGHTHIVEIRRSEIL